MKAVILAGGLGTRLSEYTDVIPKPMVQIGGKPIIWHIMRHLYSYGIKDFCIALGYRSEIIKRFFLDYAYKESDFTISLNQMSINEHRRDCDDWNVTLVETGAHSMTGGRLKRLEPYLKKERFLMTYGDGLCSVNIHNLINQHEQAGKLATVTAVHPVARFGELEIGNGKVLSFKEKPQTSQGWINGGYFIFEPECLDLIEGDDTVLEGYPLEELAKRGELSAFLHEGFWQCMDTKRDRDLLEEIFNSGNATWNY